jgi:hypothetical protein
VAATDITDAILLRSAITAFSDRVKLAAATLSIQDKKGQTVPLNYSPSQLKVSRLIRKLRKEGKPVRIVILKPRQAHFSVGCAAEIWAECAFLPGQHGACVADIFRTAKNLWSYYNQFQQAYEQRGPYMGIRQLKPINGQTGKLISWDKDSYVQFLSADSPTSGRSYSLRHLHLSEYAFYGDAATLMTGLMQSVPDDHGTTIIVESTANGIGGPFHDLWTRANDPQQAGDWVPLFFAWFEHPEYVRPLDIPPGAFQRTLDEEEQILHQRYGVQFEQLNWRRWTITNKCENSVDRFHQEYPSTPEEAFLVSGRPVFEAKQLAAMPIDRNPITGRLRKTEDFPSPRIILESAEQGELAVFRRPERHRQYAIGVDTSRGIDRGAGAGKSDPDYCVAQVLDVDTGEQVASLRGRFSPAHWADQVDVLGRWYNSAFLVPEANENGLAVIERLLTLQYPIGKIYRRRPMPDERGQVNLSELGWWTDTRTRPQLVNTLGNAIREQAVIIRKANTLAECMTFVYKPTGKPEGQSGCHDDEVIALALAVIGMIVTPRAMPTTTAQQKNTRPMQRYATASRRRDEDDD